MAFPKGKSGNPKGRPKGFKGLASEIKKKVGDDGEKLVDFAMRVFEGEPDSVTQLVPSDRMRWQAMEWLADRGFGRPVTTVDLTVESTGIAPTFNVAILGDVELDELEAKLQRMRLGAQRSPLDSPMLEAPDSE